MENRISEPNGINGVNGENGIIGTNVVDENGFRELDDGFNRKRELGKFPIHCLPEVISDYVINVSEHSQTDVDMAAAIALGVLAAVVQRKYKVEIKSGYREPLGLYVQVAAQPGERKSSVIMKMSGCLVEHEKAHPDQRLLYDDCTSEALTMNLAKHNGIGFLISSEGGIIGTISGRYSGSSNLEIYLKGHDSESVHVDRVNRSAIYMPETTLSIVLTLQPSVITEAMNNREFHDRGFNARFLYCFPESMIGKRTLDAPMMNEKYKTAYEQTIIRLYEQDNDGDTRVIRLSEEANAIIADHFAENEKKLFGQDKDFLSWCAKYIGTVNRIAGIIHMVEHSAEEEISEETMLNAIEIGKYFYKHSEYAFSLQDTEEEDPKEKLVLQKLKKLTMESENPQIKRNTLYRACRGKYFKEANQIDPVLEAMEEKGMIRIERRDNNTAGRKPDAMIILNPKLAKARY